MAVSADGLTYTFSSRLPKSAERSFQYLLVRALLGHCGISNGHVSTKQVRDFSFWPPITQTKKASVSMKEYLDGFSVGGTINRFVKVTTADNRLFFQDILSEFGHYFLQERHGSHLGGFVFLYRILERMSFSSPLMYASMASDFNATFKQLKKLFSNEGTGELGFLKAFIHEGRLIDRTILDTSATIDFSVCGASGPAFYNTAAALHQAWEVSDATRSSLVIKFMHVHDLMVTVRNRFLHFRSGDGQRNVSSRELQDVELFFKTVNPLFASYVASLMLHLIAAKYRVP